MTIFMAIVAIMLQTYTITPNNLIRSFNEASNEYYCLHAPDDVYLDTACEMYCVVNNDHLVCGGSK